MKIFLLRIAISILGTIGGGLLAGAPVAICLFPILVLSSQAEMPGDLYYLLGLSAAPLILAFKTPFWGCLALPWYLLSSYFAPRLLEWVNALGAGAAAGLLLVTYFLGLSSSGRSESLGAGVLVLVVGLILGVGTALATRGLHQWSSRFAARTPSLD